MGEIIDRILQRAAESNALHTAGRIGVQHAISHGTFDFGSALIILILITAGFAALRYAIRKAMRGESGCLITGLVVGVLLIGYVLLH